jgi:hypothetical protein
MLPLLTVVPGHLIIQLQRRTPRPNGGGQCSSLTSMSWSTIWRFSENGPRPRPLFAGLTARKCFVSRIGKPVSPLRWRAARRSAFWFTNCQGANAHFRAGRRTRRESVHAFQRSARAALPICPIRTLSSAFCALFADLPSPSAAGAEGNGPRMRQPYLYYSSVVLSIRVFGPNGNATGECISAFARIGRGGKRSRG